MSRSFKYIFTPLARWGLFATLVTLCGCISPWNTRWPTCAAKPPELERREAQIQDPFPDDQVGPSVGFRPLGYQTPRSEPQQAKDQFFVSMLRQQNRGQIAPPVQGPTLVPQPTMTPSSYGVPQYSVPVYSPGMMQPVPQIMPSQPTTTLPAYPSVPVAAPYYGY